MSLSAKHWILLAAVAAAGLALGIAAQRLNAPAAPVEVDGKLSPPRPLPELTLTDHNGQPFTLENLKGKWSLLFFGYTHCPDVCPGTLAALKKAQPQWEAAAPDTQVVFFSVDPQRDTPEVLKGYVSYFDPKFVGVTAPREMLAGLARIFGIIYIRVAGSSGEPNDYLVDHSASIVLIDPQGRLAGVLSAPHTPEDIAKRYITIRTAFLCCG